MLLTVLRQVQILTMGAVLGQCLREDANRHIIAALMVVGIVSAILSFLVGDKRSQ